MIWPKSRELYRIVLVCFSEQEQDRSGQISRFVRKVRDVPEIMGNPSVICCKFGSVEMCGVERLLSKVCPASYNVCELTQTQKLRRNSFNRATISGDREHFLRLSKAVVNTTYIRMFSSSHTHAFYACLLNHLLSWAGGGGITKQTDNLTPRSLPNFSSLGLGQNH